MPQEATRFAGHAGSTHLAATGIMRAGPVGHGWYVALDKFARARFRIGSPAFIATKVVLDEGLFGPIHVLGFFAYMTLAEGGTWEVSSLALLLCDFVQQ